MNRVRKAWGVVERQAEWLTYQVTVCVSPAFHTDPAFGFVIGGAIESRGMSVSGLARAVPKRARRDTTCMMTKNMVMTA